MEMNRNTKGEQQVTRQVNLATVASFSMITSDKFNLHADGDEKKYEREEQVTRQGKSFLRPLHPCR